MSDAILVVVALVTQSLGSLALWLALCILIHEAGHLIALWVMGRRPKIITLWPSIRIGEAKDYEGLTDTQKTFVYGSGVMLGGLGVWLQWFFNPWLTVLLAAVYIAICKKDITLIGQLSGHHRQLSGAP